MENNIHGEGKRLLDEFAHSDGFHSFDYLRTQTQSINAIHGVYAQGVEYAVVTYLEDVRDKVSEELDNLPTSENESFITAKNALKDILKYIDGLKDYRNINGLGKEILDRFAYKEGFKTFDDLLSDNSSLRRQHDYYCDGVEYAVVTYLEDVRDKVSEEMDYSPSSDNDTLKDILKYIDDLKDYKKPLW